VRACIAGFVAAATCCLAAAADPPRGRPDRTLEQLDEAFAASVRDLARRATAAGSEPLAAIISEWPLPSAPGRQLAVAIPARLEKPAAVESPETESIWSDFTAARRARAAGLYEHAAFAAGAHDRQPTRDELAARVDASRPPLEQRSCEAIRLLFLTLRDDPGHERARAAAGWVRRGDEWVTPEAARHLDRGEAFDSGFGWMPATRLTRYRAGERYEAGRWIAAAEDDAKPRDVKHGREYHGDHWEIVTTASLEKAGEVAGQLEQTRTVWRQVFGAFAWEPAELERRLAGRVRPVARTPHAAILCVDRAQYVTELEPLEPRIGMTEGIYWMPTKTVWPSVTRRPISSSRRSGSTSTACGTWPASVTGSGRSRRRGATWNRFRPRRTAGPSAVATPAAFRPRGSGSMRASSCRSRNSAASAAATSRRTTSSRMSTPRSPASPTSS